MPSFLLFAFLLHPLFFLFKRFRLRRAEHLVDDVQRACLFLFFLVLLRLGSFLGGGAFKFADKDGRLGDGEEQQGSEETQQECRAGQFVMEPRTARAFLDAQGAATEGRELVLSCRIVLDIMQRIAVNLVARAAIVEQSVQPCKGTL